MIHWVELLLLFQIFVYMMFNDRVELEGDVCERVLFLNAYKCGILVDTELQIHCFFRICLDNTSTFYEFAETIYSHSFSFSVCHSLVFFFFFSYFPFVHMFFFCF